VSEETTAAVGRGNPASRAGRRTIIASLSAIGGVLAASSCCWPILPFVAAAGVAGSSAFLTAARPYLLGASLLLIGYGFWQARKAKLCGRKPSAAVSVLLWLSMAFVVTSIFFPQVMANAIASALAR
jgi:hypothetical protein